MVSIASAWDPSAAPAGKHVAHLYTLEEYGDWVRFESLYKNLGDSAGAVQGEERAALRQEYEQKKRERAGPLFQALRQIIPDLDSRIDVTLIGSPLTHARYARRYRGTYGAAIAAPGRFPGPGTPWRNVYRVGDSVVPGIGVPAVAASAFLCVNSLVSSSQVDEMLGRIWYDAKSSS